MHLFEEYIINLVLVRSLDNTSIQLTEEVKTTFFQVPVKAKQNLKERN